MKFLTNKHVIVAMLVAPILAVISWMLVDNVVAEKPSAAVKGAAYPLVVESNCRFTSGVCDLHNNELKLRLQIKSNVNPDQATMTLSSSHALQSAIISLVDTDNSDAVKQENAINLSSLDNRQTDWQMEFLADDIDHKLARIAVRVQDSYYYADTGLTFSNYETTFDKDFRKTAIE